MSLPVAADGYAKALRFFVTEREADVSLHYLGARGDPTEGCIESALHEIAHGVSLNMDKDGTWRWSELSREVGRRLRLLPDDEGLQQEVWTIAAEVLVLKQLGFRAWRYIVDRAFHEPWTHKRFKAAVHSSLLTRETVRRAHRTMVMFKEACTMGEKGVWPW